MDGGAFRKTLLREGGYMRLGGRGDDSNMMALFLDTIYCYFMFRVCCHRFIEGFVHLGVSETVLGRDATVSIYKLGWMCVCTYHHLLLFI